MDETRRLSTAERNDDNLEVFFPRFIPTKCELKEIIKYWHTFATSLELFQFETGCGNEWGLINYAHFRINRAAEGLSKQELAEVFADAEYDLKPRRKITDEDWKIFKYGSSEEWEACRKKFREMVDKRFDERQASDPGISEEVES